MPQLTCSHCNKLGEQLPKPPIAGELGQRVYESVCQDCWNEWKTVSMRLVNHYGLRPADPEDRKKIYVFMREFFNFDAEP